MNFISDAKRCRLFDLIGCSGAQEKGSKGKEEKERINPTEIFFLL